MAIEYKYYLSNICISFYFQSKWHHATQPLKKKLKPQKIYFILNRALQWSPSHKSKGLWALMLEWHWLCCSLDAGEHNSLAPFIPVVSRVPELLFPEVKGGSVFSLKATWQNSVLISWECICLDYLILIYKQVLLKKFFLYLMCFWSGLKEMTFKGRKYNPYIFG